MKLTPSQMKTVDRLTRAWAVALDVFSLVVGDDRITHMTTRDNKERTITWSITVFFPKTK